MSIIYMTEKIIYSARGIKKTYLDEDGRTLIDVLCGVDLEIHGGEVVGIMGPSGSGKSTFLHILGFMDGNFGGDLFFDGKNSRAMSAGEKNFLLRNRIGFLFQHHHLLNELNLLENISLPLRVKGEISSGHYEESLQPLIETLGLRGKERRYPHELSGGEKQKAALARAVVKNPEVVFCDEPTGNLDHSSAESVKKLLGDLHARLGFTLVIVTHNRGLLDGLADRFYEMSDGKIKPMTN